MYSHATCIIDCSEIFLEQPSSLLARAQTFSQYKHHNTVKFLMAISPIGAIIFLSKCWGGPVSDKYLTANCGFYNYLITGDLVLADRGFNIADDLFAWASLALPSFTKGKDQLSLNEVEVSRSLSRVRIHVERAIGRLKHFKLLQLRLPISMIIKHLRIRIFQQLTKFLLYVLPYVTIILPWSTDNVNTMQLFYMHQICHTLGYCHTCTCIMSFHLLTLNSTNFL